MHLQLRTETEASPADVGRILGIVRTIPGVNIVAFGGSNLELGPGELSLVIEAAAPAGQEGSRVRTRHTHGPELHRAESEPLDADVAALLTVRDTLRDTYGCTVRIVGESDEPGYEHPQLGWVDAGLDFKYLADEPGELHQFVLEVQGRNLARGRVIQDFTIGATETDGRTPVQIYSRWVRTAASLAYAEQRPNTRGCPDPADAGPMPTRPPKKGSPKNDVSDPDDGSGAESEG